MPGATKVVCVDRWWPTVRCDRHDRWFQVLFLIFTPNLVGEMIQFWTNTCQMGLKQPPTRCVFFVFPFLAGGAKIPPPFLMSGRSRLWMMKHDMRCSWPRWLVVGWSMVWMGWVLGCRPLFFWVGVCSIQIIYQEWPLQEFQGWVTGNGRRFFWTTWKMICLRFQLFVWRVYRRKRSGIYLRVGLKYLETIHTNPFACFKVFIHWLHLPKAFLIFRKEQVPNKDKD